MLVVILGKLRKPHFCPRAAIQRLNYLQADKLSRRIRNKAKLKPFDLVDPRNTELRSFLQKAEYSFVAPDDVVQEDEDEGPTGSASDSD